jgi:RimJ/RimL family protein N-acetyltransferase
MAHRYWPLFDLRLTVGELTLRPMTEADQQDLSDLLPDDLEQDPAATTYNVEDRRTSRGIVQFQGYWRSYGAWRPEEWRLGFAVRRGGQLIGMQELEGNDFALLRTVDTSSWLVTPARGQGLGKQMRSAVLALAFGPLGARAAITSAWHDNHASLGVSRSLGYQPNGEQLHRRDKGVDVMVQLRLTREDWLAARRPEVGIDGFEPCRVFFGTSALS